MVWDPAQYARFGDERARPFFDLLARVSAPEARAIVDLGCGTGELTAELLVRWPGARVVGVDNSPEMLAQAAGRAQPNKLTFVPADLSTYEPERAFDLVLSNAALHWVPDHASLLPRLAAWVARGGSLAVQMPGNHEAPSHRILVDLLKRDRWRESATGPEVLPVQPLAWYASLLMGLGFDVDAWETTYLHVLRGSDAVLQWMKGTTLRPVLAKLSAAEGDLFLAELGERLRVAYPQVGDRTLFPFRRLFFVAIQTGARTAG